MQQIVPTADSGSWLALVTALSIAAVMFAASELSYKSLTDNEFMITLSASILEAAYKHYDLSDKRFSNPVKGEFDFNLPKYDSTMLHAEYNAISGRLSNFTQSTE